jgi:hypothetical protein
MPTHSNSIPLEQQEKARVLLALAWHFSRKPKGSGTINHHNALARHIEDEIECTIVGRSLKNFAKSLDNSDSSLAGFKRNTTKVTLAAFVLKKDGLIDEVEVVRDKSNRGINHPHPKYWIMFEENYESLKSRLPPAEQTPSPPRHETPDHEETCPLKPVMPYFEGTDWFLFSRARTGGIYRLLLTIEKEKIGHLNKVYVKNGSTQVEDYTGWVGADVGQEYLVFNLVTCESQKKHLHIKVKVGSGTLPQLEMGQSNFVSSFSPQIMSDAVVLMRAPKNADLDTAAKCLLPGTPEYLELPLCLRRYFHEMDKCRLISPRPDIINLHQLEEWVNAQRKQKEPFKQDKVLAKYCNNYAVYYQTSEGLLEERSICIFFDLNVEETSASAATDYRDEPQGFCVFRRGNWLTLFQKEPVSWETSHYYLSFQIHLQAKDPEPFSFEGHVSGFWQGLNGSVSRALVIKKSVPEAKSRQLVHDFFLAAFQVLEQQ